MTEESESFIFLKDYLTPESTIDEKFQNCEVYSSSEKQESGFVPRFKKVPKSVRHVTALIILFLSFHTFAQGFVAFEAHNHGYGINAGWITNCLDLKAGFDSPFNSKRTNPDLIYGSIGYEVFLSKYKAGNFLITPSIGFSKFHMVNKKDVEIKEGDYYGSIEFGKNFIIGEQEYGHFGRYYLFTTWAQKLFLGAGLRVFIM